MNASEEARNDAYALLGALVNGHWNEGRNIIDHCDQLEVLCAEVAAVAAAAIGQCAKDIGITPAAFFQKIAKARVT